ncbi:VOC family protein [Rhodococcus sp. NPDC059968]|uniref:VOC family protein n=1 Tax=Rhodococcus sp. NPDC059968 TaxID=3347017 RepID=UPI00366E9687
MTNKVDYFEIGSPDPEASKAFYGTLFDRQIAPVHPYRMVDQARGGVGHHRHERSQLGSSPCMFRTSRPRSTTRCDSARPSRSL